MPNNFKFLSKQAGNWYLTLTHSNKKLFLVPFKINLWSHFFQILPVINKNLIRGISRSAVYLNIAGLREKIEIFKPSKVNHMRFVDRVLFQTNIPQSPRGKYREHKGMQGQGEWKTQSFQFHNRKMDESTLLDHSDYSG